MIAIWEIIRHTGALNKPEIQAKFKDLKVFIDIRNFNDLMVFVDILDIV